MRTCVIIQARMTSTRLPGKVLKTVLGKPLLEILIERMRACKKVDQVAVATTGNRTDNPVAELCDRLGVECTRGSEHGVLERYYEAALALEASVIVRVSADCPLLDPAVVDRFVEKLKSDKLDYVGSGPDAGYPIGTACEVFRFEALERAYHEARLPEDREHVTSYIYRNADKFRSADFHYEPPSRHVRLTVDTAEDFELIKKMLTELYPKNPLFTLEDCLELWRAHPEWAAINQHVPQKGVAR